MSNYKVYGKRFFCSVVYGYPNLSKGNYKSFQRDVNAGNKNFVLPLILCTERISQLDLKKQTLNLTVYDR